MHERPKPKKGKGVRRHIRHPVKPLDGERLDKKSAESLAEVRQQALSGLSDLVSLALATLGDCLKNGPMRAQGSRSSDARYVLDVVLDRIQAPSAVPEDAEVDEDGQPTQTPVDELAARRAELQKLLRAQRRDMEKSKR
jgi:hypothetical protein